MANYSNLKNIIDQVVRTNGQGEITGANLNQTLQEMVNSLGANYQYAGVATPSTNPGSPDQNVFYIATLAGTYANFGGVTVPKGISVLRWNGSWSLSTLYTVDTGLTPNSDALVQSGAVFERFKFDGGAWNVSAHFPAGGPNNNGKYSLEYILNNADTYIPANIRIGGMSLRFIDISNNKCVQYRLMSNTFSTTVANWQGEDVNPTVGSQNLVISDGVALYADIINGVIASNTNGEVANKLIFSNSGFNISITESDKRMPSDKRLSAIIAVTNIEKISFTVLTEGYKFIYKTMDSEGNTINYQAEWTSELRTSVGNISKIRISVKHVVDGVDVAITPDEMRNLPISIECSIPLNTEINDIKNFETATAATLNSENISNKIFYNQGGYSYVQNLDNPVPNFNSKRLRAEFKNLGGANIKLQGTSEYPIVYSAWDKEGNRLAWNSTWSSGEINLSGVNFLRLSVKHVVDSSDVNISPGESVPITLSILNNIIKAPLDVANIYSLGYLANSNTATLGNGPINIVDGGIGSSTNYKHTDYIEVQEGYISVPVLKLLPTYGAGLAFYDASKTFISGSGYNDQSATSGNESMYQKTIPVPQNAVYIRISVFSDTGVYASRLTDWYVRNMNKANTELFKALDSDSQHLDRLSLIAYNVGTFWEGTRRMSEEEYQQYLPKWRAFLGKEKADVICMEEYANYMDTANTHATRDVLFAPVYRSGYVKSTGHLEAIYSKYPMYDSSEAQDLGGITDDRGYVKTYIYVGGKKVCIVCCHLWYPNTSEAAAIRQEQMQDLIDLVQDEKYAIICGDLNAQSGISEYNIFKNNGFVLCNGGYFGTFNTWHKNNPSVPLDNIIVTPNIEIENFEVLSSYANILSSDHLAIKANLLLY